MVTPKTASRMSGLAVAVGLGVAVTTGHGIASADSTAKGEGPSAPQAPAEEDASPTVEQVKSSGSTPTTAAQRTAQQRREAVRTALREQMPLSRRQIGEQSRDERDGNRPSREEKPSAGEESEAPAPQTSDRKGSGTTARRGAQEAEQSPQIRRVTTRVQAAVTGPHVPPVTAQSAQLSPPPVQSAPSPSPASPSSPVVSRSDVSPAPVAAPTTVTRPASMLTAPIADAGLSPDTTTPVVPQVPALPRLLEFAYAEWRRVVVPRVFNSTPTASVAVDYLDRDELTGEVPGAVVGHDADNDRLTYEVVQRPATGTLNFDDDGTFTYKPDQDLAHQPNPADVTFTVRVSDESSRPHLHLFSRTQHTTTATVTIHIDQLNQAPAITVSDPDPQTDGTIRFTVTPTDPDLADGNSLNVTWTEPANGSVAPVAGLTNLYAYTPDAGYAHTLSSATPDPFTFVVTDQYGKTGSAAAKPLVQPDNDAPVLTVGTPQRQSNDSYTIALSVTDGDLDSVRVTPPVLDPALGSWQGLDADGNVILSQINPSRTITFVPKPVTQVTSVTFEFNADDGHYLGTDAESTTLTLAPNQAPNFVVTHVSEPDPTTGKVTISYIKSDPDGDPVTLSASQMDQNAKFVDNGNGTATYTPDRSIVRTIGPGGAAQTDTFTIVAADGRGGTVPQDVDATVMFTNQRPFPVFGDAEVVNPITGEIKGRVTITDPDGDPASFTFASTDPSSPASATPGTLTFDLATGEYTFIPKDSVRDTRPGQYSTLIVSVKDDYSLTNTGAAVLYIVPKPVVVTPPPNLPPPNLPEVPGPVRL